jgi:hypothetical protein
MDLNMYLGDLKIQYIRFEYMYLSDPKIQYI